MLENDSPQISHTEREATQSEALGNANYGWNLAFHNWGRTKAKC